MTTQQVNETKTKKPWYMKWWVWLIAAVIVIGGIGNAIGGSDEPEPTPVEEATVETLEPEPEPDKAPEETPEPEPEQEPEPDEPKFTFDAYEIDSGLNVDARFEVRDNLTKNFIKYGAQDDTIEAIQAALSEYPDAATVWVFGSFPTTDAYGNEGNSNIVQVQYSRETIDKINFDNIDSANIWAIADSAILHPDLQD